MDDADRYTPRHVPVAQTSINIDENDYDMRLSRVKCGPERCACSLRAGALGLAWAAALGGNGAEMLA